MQTITQEMMETKISEIRKLIDDKSTSTITKIDMIGKLVRGNDDPTQDDGSSISKSYVNDSPKDELLTSKASTYIIDGVEYTDKPRLRNPDDLYYSGRGTTWDIDLDGMRYWKRYSGFATNIGEMKTRWSHLSHGDIINERARIQKIVIETLAQMNIKI